jgi:hypothetical protein
MVSPIAKQSFVKTLQASNITFRTVIENVQDSINKQLTSNSQLRLSKTNFNYELFNTLREISAWIDSIQKDYPTYLSIFEVGKSFENRPIRGLKLSVPSAKNSKPAIFMEAGIHAREWLSPATVIYMTSLVDILMSRPWVGRRES